MVVRLVKVENLDVYVIIFQSNLFFEMNGRTL